MINNIRFKIIAGKNEQNSWILHDFCPKNAQLHNTTTRSRPGRGQMFEAEVEAKASRLRPRPRPNLWGQGRDQNFGLEATLASRTKHHCCLFDLTYLTHAFITPKVEFHFGNNKATKAIRLPKRFFHCARSCGVVSIILHVRPGIFISCSTPFFLVFLYSCRFYYRPFDMDGR